MSEIIKRLQGSVPVCPHCGQKPHWFNNIPLTAFCWGTESDPHREWRCIVPERSPEKEKKMKAETK